MLTVIHSHCNRWVEVKAKWDTEDHTPVFYVDNEPRQTCPICFYPLDFESLHVLEAIDELTADEVPVFLDPVDHTFLNVTINQEVMQ